MVLTKGSSLLVMKENLKLSIVPPFILIDLLTWNNSPTSVLDQISESFSSTYLAVRSSAGNEDGIHISSAGKYQSVLNVHSEDMLGRQDEL